VNVLKLLQVASWNTCREPKLAAPRLASREAVRQTSLWGATVKAERKQQTRVGLRSVRLHALTAAAACFFATATTGCVSHHGDNAVIESHFTRLEQTCFGYEPTVWRTMSGECQQAERQIPEPVIYTPKTSETTPTTEPKESVLESVPEPGQESGGSGLFRSLLGPPVTPDSGTTPPAEPAPGTEPADNAGPATEPAEETAPVEPPAMEPAPADESSVEPAPTVEPTVDPTVDPTVEPAVEPTLEPAPAIEQVPVAPPHVEPAIAPPTDPPANQFSFSSSRQVVTAPSAVQESAPANTASANQLFRTLESALGDAPPKAPAPKAAPKKGPTGLAKFISY